MPEHIRVLYVEDNPADRELTLRHLRQHAPDMEVRVVGTGQETLEALRGDGFDLVLLDYHLPDVDGLQLLREVLASAPEVPVMMVTGSGDHEVAVAALKTGATDYVIKKPGHLDRLPTAVREALGRFRYERSRRAAGLRILYAEHDPADVDLTLRHLAVHGAHLEVETAGTGAAALQKLEAGRYDLLLLDYRMPDLNGLEILQEMRERGLRLPVVIVTGHGDEETAVQALKLGAADYLVKREGYLIRLASTIENAIAQRALADEKEALLTLNGIAKAVASTLDLDEVLRTVATAATTLLRVDRSLASLLSADGSELVPVAWHGGPDEVASRLRFRVGQDVPGRAAAERRAISVPDVRLEEATIYRQEAVLEGVGGVLCVPILAHSRLLGGLTVASTGRRAFTPSEEALLTALAAHAAVGIQNARLYREEQARHRQVEAVRAIGTEITRELDLPTLLELIVRRATELLRVASGTVHLWDEAAQVLVPRAWVGLGEWVRSVHLRLGDGISGTVAQRRAGLIVNDYRAWPAASAAFVERTGITATLAEPLLYRDRLLGVITVGNQGTGHLFTEQDRELLALFADQAAIAIENARLYEDVQRAAVQLEARVEDRTRELATANAQLQEAMRQVQQASRHKSEFLANMSHELRTPLNSVIGFAEVLRDQAVGPLTEKQARYLAHIESGGRHLLQLISDILDLAKVEAGKIVLQLEALPVAATLEDILIIARGLANKKSQTLRAEIAPDLPPLRADLVRFKQICFNLLSNAAKFTPDGGLITVRARTVMAEVQGSRGAGAPSPLPPSPPAPLQCLEIAVQDTGIGIKAEDMPRLFKEFVQLEAAAGKRHEGTGLGLALTKRLLELHGGRIWATSPGEGQGSTFTILLPFEGPGERET